MTAAPHDALASASLVLARHFHRGATLWCWSPAWPTHAEHLAVEFVHPVIVGKRARPAIVLAPDGAAARLRHSARPGDVLVAIGSGDDAGLLDVVGRAPAWGIGAILLAHGERPTIDTGANVVWLGAAADHADIVCAYHLLWELTHVCSEQPDLLDGAAEASTCPACMDAGELGEVDVATAGFDSTVIVAGLRRHIDLTLVEPCQSGDLVIVHAGVAIKRLEAPVILGATRG